MWALIRIKVCKKYLMPIIWSPFMKGTVGSAVSMLDTLEPRAACKKSTLRLLFSEAAGHVGRPHSGV